MQSVYLLISPLALSYRNIHLSDDAIFAEGDCKKAHLHLLTDTT